MKNVKNSDTKTRKIFPKVFTFFRFWAATFIGGFVALVGLDTGGLTIFFGYIIALIVWMGVMEYNKWRKGAFFSGFIAWCVTLFFFGMVASLLGMK